MKENKDQQNESRREQYARPECLTVTIRSEGIICGSVGDGGYGNGGGITIP